MITDFGRAHNEAVRGTVLPDLPETPQESACERADLHHYVGHGILQKVGY